MGRKGAGRNAFVKATLSKAKEDDVEDTGDAVGHQDDQTADKIGNGKHLDMRNFAYDCRQ